MEAIYGKCPYCGGTGQNLMDAGTVLCPRCAGSGRAFLAEIDLSKLEEIKTKLNVMQADINHIRAKVDNIWDKVK